MKQILQIFLLLIIFSCNKVGVSKTEVEAVDKVLQFYGGQVNRSIGFKTTNGKKTNYFELQISKSQLLNNDQKYTVEQAGNIAYIFYSNLKNEKSNYDEIRVKIDLENGNSQEYKFSSDELKEIENLNIEIEKTNNYIKNADYKSLAEQTGKEDGASETDLKNMFNQLYSKYGDFKQVQYQGFSFRNNKNYGNFINVKEAIMLEKTSGAMILSYERKTKKLIGIGFP